MASQALASIWPRRSDSEAWKAAAEQNVATLQGALSATTPRLDSLETWKDDINTRVGGLGEWRTTADPRIGTLEMFRTNVTPRVDNLEALQRDFTPWRDTTNTRVGGLETWQTSANKDLDKLKDCCKETKSGLKDLTTFKTQAEGDIKKLKTEVSTINTSVGTLKTEVSTLNTTVGILKTDFGSFTKDLVKIKAFETKVNNDIQTLKDCCQEGKDNIKLLNVFKTNATTAITDLQEAYKTEKGKNETALSKINSAIYDTNETVKCYGEDIKNLKLEKEKSGASIENINTLINTTNVIVKANQGDIQMLKTEKDKNLVAINHIHTAINNTNNDVKGNGEEIKDLKDRVKTAEKEIQKLKTGTEGTGPPSTQDRGITNHGTLMYNCQYCNAAGRDWNGVAGNGNTTCPHGYGMLPPPPPPAIATPPQPTFIYTPISGGSPESSRGRSRTRRYHSGSSAAGAYNYNATPHIAVDLVRSRAGGLFSKPTTERTRVHLGGGVGEIGAASGYGMRDEFDRKRRSR